MLPDITWLLAAFLHQQRDFHEQSNRIGSANYILAANNNDVIAVVVRSMASDKEDYDLH